MQIKNHKIYSVLASPIVALRAIGSAWLARSAEEKKPSDDTATLVLTMSDKELAEAVQKMSNNTLAEFSELLSKVLSDSKALRDPRYKEQYESLVGIVLTEHLRRAPPEVQEMPQVQKIYELEARLAAQKAFNAAAGNESTRDPTQSPAPSAPAQPQTPPVHKP